MCGPVVTCCEYTNESLGASKDGEILDQWSNHYFCKGTLPFVLIWLLLFHIAFKWSSASTYRAAGVRYMFRILMSLDVNIIKSDSK